MDIEIKIDSEFINPKVIIVTKEVDEKVNDIISKLKEEDIKDIVGYKDKKATIINYKDVIRIYSENQNVFLQTKENIFKVKGRLYHYENSLSQKKFVRISNCEIINIDKVNNFDLSISQVITVNLENGVSTYVSRRYIKKIKNILNI